jgi:hypothetical protein
MHFENQNKKYLPALSWLSPFLVNSAYHLEHTLYRGPRIDGEGSGR